MDHTLIFRCPVTLEAVEEYFGMETYELDGTADRATEINEAIESDGFWSENQAQFFDNDAIIDIRYNVVYENFMLWGQATVTTSRVLTDQEEKDLVEDITGQFSDGWGEAFEQSRISGEEPYRHYYARFWSDKPFWSLTRFA